MLSTGMMFRENNIHIADYDNLEAFEEVSPLTFRKGNYHRHCYDTLVEEAKETDPDGYANRWDEFIDKDLAIIN